MGSQSQVELIVPSTCIIYCRFGAAIKSADLHFHKKAITNLVMNLKWIPVWVKGAPEISHYMIPHWHTSKTSRKTESVNTTKTPTQETSQSPTLRLWCSQLHEEWQAMTSRIVLSLSKRMLSGDYNLLIWQPASVVNKVILKIKKLKSNFRADRLSCSRVVPSEHGYANSLQE